jgi:hypothetical protein
MSSSRGLNDRNKVSLRYTDGGKKKAKERINGVRTIPDSVQHVATAIFLRFGWPS